MREVVEETLPPSYGYDWSGEAREEVSSGSTSAIAFVFGLIFVFLILAAQYESWSLPVGVMMAVPFAILGALVAIALRGIAERSVLPDRPADAGRTRGEERDPDRRVRGGTAREGRQVVLRRGGRSGAAAAAADRHDFVRVHPRHRAARDRDRRVREQPPLDRHRRHRRHARRDRDRDLLHPDVLLGVRDMEREAVRREETRRRAAGARSTPLPTHRSSTDDAPARVTAVLLGLLAGCAVGPDYHRPDVDVPEKYLYQIDDVTETANTQWWKQFDDPVLDQLIVDALAGNKNVMIAAANVEQAAGVFTTRALAAVSADRLSGRRHAAAPARPPRDAGNTEPRQFVSGVRDRELGDRSVGPHPPPDRVGARESARHAGSAARRTAVVGVIGRNDLPEPARVRRTARHRAAHARRVRRVGEAVRAAVQIRRGVRDDGRSGTFAVRNRRRAESRRSSSRSCSRRTPCRFCSAAIPDRFRAASRSPTSSAPSIPAGLPSQLLERRPDIAQAEQNLIGANAQIGAAKALYFPTISLTGLFGGASTDLSDLFDGASETWNYAGSITGPIFAGGGISGQVARGDGVAESRAVQLRSDHSERVCRRRQRAVRQAETRRRTRCRRAAW